MLPQFLLITVLAGFFIFQGAFPRPMGEPGVKVGYLGKTRVSAQEKHAIVALVFSRSSLSECVSPERTEAEEIDAIRIVHATLAKGERNLLVQASDSCNCGASGNCAFWILRQRPGGFDTLLRANMVQRFSIESSSSNGHKDVITASHGSASYSDLALYQFDGKKYHKTRCGAEEYKLRDDGTFDEKPTITSAKCGQ